MVKVICPKCGASVVEVDGAFKLFDENRCTELPGTKWFGDHGITYCPALSDAAPSDWMLLPPGYRSQVEADIAKAKAEGGK
jgi:hypothetical protein